MSPEIHTPEIHLLGLISGVSWVKFEEKVEDGGERWSKPHVTALPLHSLLELRTCLRKGTVLLDLDARSLKQIVGGWRMPAWSLCISDLRDFPCITDAARSGLEPGAEISEAPLPEQLRNRLRKKIPAGAEVSNVLVGEVDFLEGPFIAFIRLQEAVGLGALTEVAFPSRFLFILLGPRAKVKAYHEIGRAVATVLTDELFQRVAYQAQDRDDLIAGVDEFLDELTVLPPGKWDPTVRIAPPKCLPSPHRRLQTSHGVESISKAPWYWSDFSDALSVQCLSAVLYIYLATVTNAITFGGMLGDATDNMQSPAHPSARDHGLDYLEFRLWIGLWVAFFGLVLVATEASHLVQYFTRFTEEGFCALISFIFIYDAVKKMLGLADSFPVHWDYRIDEVQAPEVANRSLLTRTQCLREGGHLVGTSCNYVPDVTLLSFILFLGTFLCSTTSQSAGTKGPTNPQRGWVVSPFGSNPWWVCLASAVPAVLVIILVFMDQQITAVILNRRRVSLQKGAGFHLDLFCVSLLMILTSVTGLPWYVSATVISLAHMDSLKKESTTSAPGEPPRFLGIRKVHLTMLSHLPCFPQYISMPVLYGVFLYMGVAALSSIQVSTDPQRSIPLTFLHLFLHVLLCLLALVGIRKAMERIFSRQDLAWLDDVLPETDRKEEEKLRRSQEEESDGEDVRGGGGRAACPKRPSRDADSGNISATGKGPAQFTRPQEKARDAQVKPLLPSGLLTPVETVAVVAA
nr:anion exchange protein 4 [Pelodiscus sinensis]|eukprot:XP_025044242.1 anion exchange protein 4 [Pelodiscus sinensis]